jgi:nucleoside-diphosphate-sugar epimerase
MVAPFEERAAVALRRKDPCMVVVVTGAGGFIGSHLCGHLLASGDEVRGVDAFTDYYSHERKEENLVALLEDDRFTFYGADLLEMPLEALLDGADVVYHLAGQPGVRSSWGSDFAEYLQHNVLATQRLLEACADNPPEKFLFASSSSIYGDTTSSPTSESTCPHPVSPYGVTKLAAEHLCDLYRARGSVRTASLRLFTVFGPRQRPDMAFSRLVSCALRQGGFELYGDGEQTRDCTFVGDVVKAMRNAATSNWLGVANIGGGLQISMNEVIALLSEICGPIDVKRTPPSPGDVRHTAADTRLAQRAFGYRPSTTLREGLEAMVAWERGREALAA